MKYILVIGHHSLLGNRDKINIFPLLAAENEKLIDLNTILQVLEEKSITAFQKINSHQSNENNGTGTLQWRNLKNAVPTPGKIKL